MTAGWSRCSSSPPELWLSGWCVGVPDSRRVNERDWEKSGFDPWTVLAAFQRAEAVFLVIGRSGPGDPWPPR